MPIEPIARVSPSLFSRLESCGLAEALSRRATTGGARPSRPPARLGTAAHVVLEALLEQLVEGSAPDDMNAWVNAQWEAQCAIQHTAARWFDEERLLGPPVRWPNYFDIKARLLIEARRLADAAATWPAGAVHIEKWLSNDELGLEGKPDLVITGERVCLVDFKSGRPTAAQVDAGTSYASQIAIYSALLRADGFPVEEAFVQPLGRAALPVHTSREVEEQVGQRSKELASIFNAAAAAGREDELGAPSDAACAWCPHAAVCPALWTSLEALNDLQGVDGEVVAVRQSASGVTLRMNVTNGTVRGDVTVTQLRPVGVVQDARIGRRIRLVGLVTLEGQPSILAAPRSGWVRARLVDPGSIADDLASL